MDIRRIITILIIMTGVNARARKDGLTKAESSYWHKSGFFGLNASQTSLRNWQGGGQDNVALNAILNLEAVYRRDKFEKWTNKLDVQYGIFQPGFSHPFRKNTDQLFALSKYELKAFRKNWYYMTQADYRTQFAPGKVYDGDSVVGRATSDINSPGYIQLAVSLDYKPTEYFSATIAPLAGKITGVNRQYLADDGAYGIEAAKRNADGT